MNRAESEKKIQYIRSKLNVQAICLAVAEECGELTQAVSKYPRATGAVFNPTPVEATEAYSQIHDEAIDTLNALWALGFDPIILASESASSLKIDRWKQRIKEADYLRNIECNKNKGGVLK